MERMMERGKGIAAVLAALAAVLLAACSGAAAPTAVPANPQAATAAPASGAAPAATAAPATGAAPTGAASAQAPAANAGEKPTGKLTFVAGPEEQYAQAVAKAFEAKTGIKTSFVRLSSGEAVARFKAEKDNPQFSVWWAGPADGYIAAKKEGLLEKYVSPNAAKIPALLKDPEGFWTGIYVGSLGFAVNTEYLAKKGLKAPESWEDLLKPEWKGQVAMAHPATSGTAYTMLATIIQLNNRDEAKAYEYMKKLNQNILQYSKTGAAPGRMAGQGEAGIGIVFSHDTVAFMEQGYPLALSFPREGTGYETGAVALIKGGKEPVEARQFIDWALTKEAQEIGPTVKSYQAPTNPDAKPSRPELLKVSLINYDLEWAGGNKKRLVEKFETEVVSGSQARD